MQVDGRKNGQTFWHNFFSVLYLALVVLAIYSLNLGNKLDKNISWFDFTLLFLATFRLIRLFVYDTVTEHIRAYLRNYHYGYRRELSMLIHCPWCTGIWSALFVTFIFFYDPLSRFFILALALAGAGSFLQTVAWKIGLDPKDSSK